MRPTMLKLGAAPITPSLFWLPVMVYAPGPGIVSHSYGRLPLSGGMLRHQHEPRLAANRAEDGVRKCASVCWVVPPVRPRDVNDGT